MKRLLLIVAAIVAMGSAAAQQNLWKSQNVVSPEIGDDGRVTFRLYAPEAKSVEVAGDFLAPGIESAVMTRSEDGLWSYTTEPLESEMYYYSLRIDGMRDINDPSNPYLVRDVATQMNYFIIGGTRGDLYMAQDVKHGTVARQWAEMGGRQRRMAVYTPAGYEDSRRSYPVLYLLHGMGGDEEAWLATGRLAEIMDNLIAAGKAEEMIVVMTNGCTRHVAAPGYSHEGMWHPYMSGSMDGSFESLFPDIVEWVDDHYRTIAHKDKRAIAGLSMGGFHSMQISKEQPEMFGYVGLFSAAIFRGDEGVEIYADLETKLERQFSEGVKLYWIAIGRDDFLYDENVKFRALLDAKGYPYTYRESEGGHVWRNWRVYVAEFTQMLFK